MEKTREPYNEQEIELFIKYYKTSMTKLNLFKKLHEINPRRSFESMARHLRAQKAKGIKKDDEIMKSKLKVGYLDIEATQLVADFGYMISWFIKEKGKEVYQYGVVTQKEVQSCQFDKRIVSELLEALKQYQVIYTHYGIDKRFDLPFIRTRAYKHGLQDQLPDYGDCYIFDTYDIAKKKLKLSRNRLDNIARNLGVKIEKTPVAGDEWCRAAVGDSKAIAYIVDHNKRDVQILEEVHKKLEKIEVKNWKSI